MCKHPVTRAFGAALLFWTSSAVASDPEELDQPAFAEVTDRVEVRFIRGPGGGITLLNFDVLQRQAIGDGDLANVLKRTPGVQLSESALGVERAGEIDPERISISGGRFYDNLFQIDGFSNNSRLDPGFTASTSFEDVPGHFNRAFVPIDFLGSLEIFRANAPVEFGGFSGGVVRATTRRPSDAWTSEVGLSFQQPSWTRYIELNPQPIEPEFRKRRYTAQTSGPVGPGGVLLALSRTRSETGRINIGRFSEEDRVSDSLFAKYQQAVGTRSELESSLLIERYSADFTIFNTAANDQNINRVRSQAWSNRLVQSLRLGELEHRFNLQYSENTRSSANEFFSWRAFGQKALEIPFAFNFQGGQGDLEKSESGAEYFVRLVLPGRVAGNWNLQWSGGAEFEHLRGRFARPVDHINHDLRDETFGIVDGQFAITVNPPLACASNDPACIVGEQYFVRRVIRPAQTTRATLNEAALFIQLDAQYGRLFSRAGLRLDYDDLLENLNVAPRLLLGLDAFDTGATIFTLGLNRYYGRTFLGQRLREGQLARISERRSLEEGGRPGDWAFDEEIGNIAGFRQLETPYADEVAIGVDQELLGGVFSLSHQRRWFRDEFQRQSEQIAPRRFQFFFNNNGKTNYEAWYLSWGRSWGRWSLDFNATRQETVSNGLSYDGPTVTDESLTREVIFEGERIFLWQLPRGDFNRKYTANLIGSLLLPEFDLTLNGTLRHLGGYEAVQRQSTPDPLTGLDLYEATERPSSTVLDLNLIWTPSLVLDSRLRIGLEASNITNRRTFPMGAVQDYELGRQYWLTTAISF